MGDQQVQALSDAYTAGRLQRERLAGKLAFIAPPVLLERLAKARARTDLRASLAYEAKVRTFHTELRGFYYPKLFADERFQQAALEAMPRFAATKNND